MKNSKGFTLMEVLIVVAIIGILAAVSFPSYQNSLIKGNRGNAKAFLMEVVQREQQYLMDNRSYGTLAQLGMATPSDFDKFYTLSITVDAGPPPAFLAKASPKSGTRQYKDGWLAISNTGTKTSQHPDKW